MVRKSFNVFPLISVPDIKCKNLVIFSFEIRMKHNFLLSINQV